MYIKLANRSSTRKTVHSISKEGRNAKDAGIITERIKISRKERRQIIRNHLRSDFAVSSTHGIPYSVNRDLHWCERLFWVVLFTGNLVLAAYLLAVQFKRFIETPTVMSVEMDYFNWNVSYPSFTLCPVFKTDPIRFSALINETKERTGLNLDKYFWAIASANVGNMGALQMHIDLPNDIVSLIDPNDYVSIAANVFHTFDISSMTTNTNWSISVEALIDPKDYVSIAANVFHTFDSSSMTTNTNWPISVEAVMTELGMCHTVNSNIAAFDDPFKWNATSFELYTNNNIQLSVHDRDFFTQIMGYADIYRVYIHSPDETVLTTTASYTHSLKGFMSFGVQMWVTKVSDELRAADLRLRKCRLLNEPVSERYPVYSYNRCLLECRIQMILKICRCIPHFYKPLPNERICRIDELKCLIRYKKEIVALSATEEMIKKYGKSLPRSSRDCRCISMCDSIIYSKDDETFLPQPDFNRLRIGVSSYPKLRVVREFIFNGYEVLLKIGGVINLCIGSSVISMVEILVTYIKIPLYLLIRNVKSLMSV